MFFKVLEVLCVLIGFYLYACVLASGISYSIEKGKFKAMKENMKDLEKIGKLLSKGGNNG